MFICPKSGRNMVSVLLNLHGVVVQSQQISCCSRNIKNMVSQKKEKSLYILSALNGEEENGDDIWSLLGKSCLGLFFLEG